MSLHENKQTAEVDALANIIERQPALLSTGSDQQDWFRSREIAEAVIAAGYRITRPASSVEVDR